MIFLLSPAKSLDFETKTGIEDYTIPEFQEYSEKLIKKAKGLSKKKIKELMGISDNLVALNYQRFQDWEPSSNVSESNKQALFSFTGDVYRGLDSKSIDKKQLKYTQDNLRILSGLYGLLKPMDLIMPYRLEMGKKLAVGKNKNLYEFWGELLTNKLNEELASKKEKTIINLASNEYFKAIKPKLIDGKIISPQFKDAKSGQYKTIMTFAKLARGYMARYIIDHKIDNSEEILGFNSNGYSYNSSLSTAVEPVFTREENWKAK